VEYLLYLSKVQKLAVTCLPKVGDWLPRPTFKLLYSTL
jgi:hypothetical protein